MLLEEICLKLYLWPLLSHLANSKGVCPRTGFTSTPFPFITLPPGATLGTTTTTTARPTVPTFQPTLPPVTTTTAQTLPTFATLPTTTPPPATITTTTTTVAATTTTILPTTQTTTTVQSTTSTQQTLPPVPPTICPIFPVVCLPGGATPNPPCPCIDPRKYIYSGRASSLLRKATNCFGLDQQRGMCTNIAGCPYIIEEFYYQLEKNPNILTFDAFLSKSICGYDGKNFLICCPIRGQPVIQPSAPSGADVSVALFHFASLNSINTPTPREVESNVTPERVTQSTAAPQPTPRRFTLPSSEEGLCGLSNMTQTRVVGGVNAKPGAYPWIAVLGYRVESTDQRKFLCAGSLVTVRHVLTSAHCITPDLIIVRLGAHNLSVVSNEVVDEEIESAIVHEDFDRNEVKNDIALLKLKKDVPLGNIRPICLPLSEPVRSLDFIGLNPFVAGWGAILFQGPSSNTLQDAQLPVISVEDCEKSYQKRFPTLKLENIVLCAGGGPADACQGDSGGPLMLPYISSDKLSFHYYLIGIVSFGYECARSGFPGIYTRVTAYIPWIENQINK